MKNDKIPFVGQILFAFGSGVALAVSQDNIAIEIGVTTAFLVGIVVRYKNSHNTPAIPMAEQSKSLPDKNRK